MIYILTPPLHYVLNINMHVDLVSARLTEVPKKLANKYSFLLMPFLHALASWNAFAFTVCIEFHLYEQQSITLYSNGSYQHFFVLSTVVN